MKQKTDLMHSMKNLNSERNWSSCLLISLLILLITGWLLLSTCCVSSSVTVKVPDVTFPEFPKLPEHVTMTDKGVIVPEQWLIDMAVYKVQIEKTEQLYKGLKEIYHE